MCTPSIDDGKCSDIIKILDAKFYDREEMITLVRLEAKKHGFNICIPRGDTILNDGTEQVTLYCDKYGLKRRRIQDCKERFSKKTNCKWKVKFQKRAGMHYYELVKTPNNIHNHLLNQHLLAPPKFVKRKHEFDEYDKSFCKRQMTTENPEIINLVDCINPDSDIICESSSLINKQKVEQDNNSKKSLMQQSKEPSYISNDRRDLERYSLPLLTYRTASMKNNHYNDMDKMYRICNSSNNRQQKNSELNNFVRGNFDRQNEVPKFLSQSSSQESGENSNQNALDKVSENNDQNNEDNSDTNIFDSKSINENMRLTHTQSDIIGCFKKVCDTKGIKQEIATQSLFDHDDSKWCLGSNFNNEFDDRFFEMNFVKDEDSVRFDFADYENESTTDLTHLNMIK